jgi:hypothetical protein
MYFESYFAGARLVCVDVSLRSLMLGRQRCTEGAEFVAFDDATLPFADGSVDLVFAPAACSTTFPRRSTCRSSRSCAGCWSRGHAQRIRA